MRVCCLACHIAHLAPCLHASRSYEKAGGDSQEYVEISSWCVADVVGARHGAARDAPRANLRLPLAAGHFDVCRDNTFCGISVDPPHGVHCWGRDSVESRPDLHTAI